MKAPPAAGHVIEAFGNFVMGGNFVIGIIVFAISRDREFRRHQHRASGRIAESRGPFPP